MSKTSSDWQQLAISSHYQTAVAVDEALRRGDVPEAQNGLEELIEALARSEKRALRSQLIRLMTHVIKWKAQPQKRSRSWRSTIRNSRREISLIQEETPSLTKSVIKEMWNDCFDAANGEAEGEMNQKSDVGRLTWAEVFEKEYEIE